MSITGFKPVLRGLTLGTGGFSLSGDNEGFCSAILRKTVGGQPARLESLAYLLPSQGQEVGGGETQPPVVVNLLMQLRASCDQNNIFLRTGQTSQAQIMAQLRQALARSDRAVRAQAGEIERAVRNSLFQENEFRQALSRLEREVKKNGSRPGRPAPLTWAGWEGAHPKPESVRRDVGSSVLPGGGRTGTLSNWNGHIVMPFWLQTGAEDRIQPGTDGRIAHQNRLGPGKAERIVAQTVQRPAQGPRGGRPERADLQKEIFPALQPGKFPISLRLDSRWRAQGFWGWFSWGPGAGRKLRPAGEYAAPGSPALDWRRIAPDFEGEALPEGEQALERSAPRVFPRVLLVPVKGVAHRFVPQSGGASQSLRAVWSQRMRNLARAGAGNGAFGFDKAAEVSRQAGSHWSRLIWHTLPVALRTAAFPYAARGEGAFGFSPGLRSARFWGGGAETPAPGFTETAATGRLRRFAWVPAGAAALYSPERPAPAPWTEPVPILVGLGGFNTQPVPRPVSQAGWARQMEARLPGEDTTADPDRIALHHWPGVGWTPQLRPTAPGFFGAEGYRASRIAAKPRALLGMTWPVLWRWPGIDQAAGGAASAEHKGAVPLHRAFGALEWLWPRSGENTRFEGEDAPATIFREPNRRMGLQAGSRQDGQRDLPQNPRFAAVPARRGASVWKRLGESARWELTKHTAFTRFVLRVLGRLPAMVGEKALQPQRVLPRAKKIPQGGQGVQLWNVEATRRIENSPHSTGLGVFPFGGGWAQAVAGQPKAGTGPVWIGPEGSPAGKGPVTARLGVLPFGSGWAPAAAGRLKAGTGPVWIGPEGSPAGKGLVMARLGVLPFGGGWAPAAAGRLKAGTGLVWIGSEGSPAGKGLVMVRPGALPFGGGWAQAAAGRPKAGTGPVWIRPDGQMALPGLVNFAQPLEPLEDTLPDMPSKGGRGTGPRKGSPAMIFRSPAPAAVQSAVSQEREGEDILAAQAVPAEQAGTMNRAFSYSAPTGTGGDVELAPGVLFEQRAQTAGQGEQEVNYNRLAEEILIRIERRLRAERRKFGL